MASSDVEPVLPEAPALTGPVMMNQDWRDLTFLHWAVDPALVADRMPPGVVLRIPAYAPLTAAERAAQREYDARQR